MESLGSLLLILFFLALGMLGGRTPLLRGSRAATLLLDLCLYALLFFMGVRIGESEAIRSQLLRVGFIAAVTACASVVGTALVIGGTTAFWGRRRRSVGERPIAPRNAATAAMVHLKDPFRLFGAVAAGLLLGYLMPVVPEPAIGHITTWLLYLLIFMIGFQLVRGGVGLRAALLKPRTLLVPAGTVIGTLAAGAAVAPLLCLPPGRAMALAAGFGWYSLSGVLITNLGDPLLGSAAFVSNMLREGIALIVIPLLGRTGFGEVAVGIGGATSMDVTLPLIGRSCGGSFVPLAVASGAILSFLVPILVPVLYGV